MPYIRFWIRTCIIFCPLLFVLLYFGVHITFWKALLSTGITGCSGIVLTAPIALLATRLDRSLWSDEEYQKRLSRKKQRLAAIHQHSSNPVTDENE